MRRAREGGGVEIGSVVVAIGELVALLCCCSAVSQARRSFNAKLAPTPVGTVADDFPAPWFTSEPRGELTNKRATTLMG